MAAHRDILELDHLAVCAQRLEDGVRFVEQTLGVSMQPGGQHPYYGTHNRLLGLADGLYLEVIAIDPDGDAPNYPRWFDLDRFSGPARLTHWICRSRDLSQIVQQLPHAGTPVALSRGALRWQMSVPESGALPYDNCFPPLIEWASEDHPAQRLPASGCGLKKLIVQHPDAQALEEQLSPRLRDPRIAFETGKACVRAAIETPGGVQWLG